MSKKTVTARDVREDRVAMLARMRQMLLQHLRLMERLPLDTARQCEQADALLQNLDHALCSLAVAPLRGMDRRVSRRLDELDDFPLGKLGEMLNH